jgi:hypothetical protein
MRFCLVSLLTPDERDLGIQETFSGGVGFPPVNHGRAGNHHEELPRLIGLSVTATLNAFRFGLVDVDGHWS